MGNIILGILSVLSFVLAFVSEEYRIVAILLAFVLLVILIVSVLSFEIFNLKSEQSMLAEKLKIHEHLISMKAEIKELQREVFNDKKK